MLGERECVRGERDGVCWGDMVCGEGEDVWRGLCARGREGGCEGYIESGDGGWGIGQVYEGGECVRGRRESMVEKEKEREKNHVRERKCA